MAHLSNDITQIDLIQSRIDTTLPTGPIGATGATGPGLVIHGAVDYATELLTSVTSPPLDPLYAVTGTVFAVNIYDEQASPQPIYDAPHLWQYSAETDSWIDIGTLPISSIGDLFSGNNLSDVQSASISRINLGLEIGVDVQAWSSILDNTTASFTVTDQDKLNLITVTSPINLDDLGSSVAIGINPIWEAEGDLLVGTGNDAGAILPVGQDGYVLMADSNVIGGVKWADAAEASCMGNVYSYGIPEDNQLAIWNSRSTIEGVAGLTYDIDASPVPLFTVDGDTIITGTINGFNLDEIGGTVQGTDAHLYNIRAHDENGTTSAGNGRGEHSVDLQTNRNLPSEVASGLGSVIAGGINNTAAGQYSSAVGSDNESIADYSNTSGKGASGYFANSHTIGASWYNNPTPEQRGEAQTTTLILRQETTGATSLDLQQDNGQPLIIPVDTSWTFNILLTATQISTGSGTLGDTHSWRIFGCIKNINSTTSLVGLTETTQTFDPAAEFWTVDISADDSNDSLKLSITGETNKTIRWVARMDLSEVGW